MHVQRMHLCIVKTLLTILVFFARSIFSFLSGNFIAIKNLIHHVSMHVCACILLMDMYMCMHKKKVKSMT